jgi:hypothetical protein
LSAEDVKRWLAEKGSHVEYPQILEVVIAVREPGCGKQPTSLIVPHLRP